MELVLKIVASIVSVIALGKVITETQSSKSARRREEYEFSKKYIADLEREETHPFSIERGFMALAGRVCGVQEIRLLLALPFPTRAIQDWANSQPFIEFDPNHQRYHWKGNYNNATVRRIGSTVLTGLYYVTAFAGTITILLFGESILKHLGALAFAVSMVFIAVGILLRAENLKVAKQFMSRWVDHL